MLIQAFTTIIVIYLLGRIASRFKRKEISAKEAFAWSVLWLGVFLLVLYPKFADLIASKIGLKTATGIDLVVYIAVGVLFYIIFRLFIRVEKIERDITKIVRHIAQKEEDKNKQ